MVLIEGLGDEVTLVLGSFLVIVILLLAWISTHTDDIPLIREVGVIVVELRQRHRNRQQARTEPQEVEISQTSREGFLSSEELESENGSEQENSSNQDEDINRSRQQHQDSNITSTPPELSLPPGHASASQTVRGQSSTSVPQTSRSNPSLNKDHHSKSHIQREETTTTGADALSSPSASDSGGDGSSEPQSQNGENVNTVDNINNDSSSPPSVPVVEESVIISSASSSHLSSYSLRGETEEETLRRRRVEYFQTGGVVNSVNTNIITPVGDGSASVTNYNNSDVQRLSDSVSTTSTTITTTTVTPTNNLVNDRRQTVGGASGCDNNISHSGNKTEPVAESPVPSEGVHRQSSSTPANRNINKSQSNDGGEQLSHLSSQEITQQTDESGGGGGGGQQGDNNEEVEIAGYGEDNLLDGSRIRVKLKYMNETQRFVYASPADTIGDFRRTHFQSELQDNKWVRFIFNGQDLRDDARTLQACNIENNCTMHCLVTTRQQPRERAGGEGVAEEVEADSMLGAMMYPLFTLMLLIIWYFRIFYRQYFSAMSTVCLIGISFLLGLSYVSSLRNAQDAAAANAAAATGQQQAPQQPAAPPQPATGRHHHPHSD